MCEQTRLFKCSGNGVARPVTLTNYRRDCRAPLLLFPCPQCTTNCPLDDGPSSVITMVMRRGTTCQLMVISRWQWSLDWRLRRGKEMLIEMKDASSVSREWTRTRSLCERMAHFQERVAVLPWLCSGKKISALVARWGKKRCGIRCWESCSQQQVLQRYLFTSSENSLSGKLNKHRPRACSLSLWEDRSAFVPRNKVKVDECRLEWIS